MILLLSGVIGLPVLLRLVGLPSRADMYRGVTREAGDFAYMRRVFFEEQGQLDMLFFGASLLRQAVDGKMVEQALSEKLGRPAKVVVCGANWAGLDIQYFLLRDLLQRRRVHTLVLSVPIAQQDNALPHVNTYRVERFGDDPDLFRRLDWRSATSLYGAMVLGAPRQMLNLVRANRPELRTPGLEPVLKMELGYYGAPFVRDQRRPPAFSAESLIYSSATASQFHFRNRSMGHYQMAFLERLADLFRDAGVRVVILNLPTDLDRNRDVVEERLLWTDYLGANARIAGVSSTRLFPGFSDEEFYRFYSDQHFNRNGSEYFTAAMIPAFLALYDDF
jgi:hypothetical protein